MKHGSAAGRGMKKHVLVFLVLLLAGCGSVKETLKEGVTEGVKEGVPEELKQQVQPLTEAVGEAQQRVKELGRQAGKEASGYLGEKSTAITGSERGQEAIRKGATLLEQNIPDVCAGMVPAEKCTPAGKEATAAERAEAAAARAEAAARKLESLLERVERCCAGK